MYAKIILSSLIVSLAMGVVVGETVNAVVLVSSTGVHVVLMFVVLDPFGSKIINAAVNKKWTTQLVP